MGRRAAVNALREAYLEARRRFDELASRYQQDAAATQDPALRAELLERAQLQRAKSAVLSMAFDDAPLHGRVYH